MEAFQNASFSTSLHETSSAKHLETNVLFLSFQQNNENSGVGSDSDVSGINLLPTAEDEEEIQAEEKEQASREKGLSKARQRQVERALRRRAGRAGRHFYEEVSVKNRSRR